MSHWMSHDPISAARSLSDCPDDELRRRIEALQAEHSGLSRDGLYRWGQRHDNEAHFTASRQALTGPDALERIRHALTFLSSAERVRPLKSYSEQHTSGSLKVVAERWTGHYISDGCFTTAALLAGYRALQKRAGRPESRLNLTLSRAFAAVPHW